MCKFVALLLVLLTIFSIILTISDAYENDGNLNEFSSNVEKNSVNGDFNREKFVKKYHKEREKKNYYPSKDSVYKQDKNWEPKETEKKFSNENDFDEFQKTVKSNKYEKRGNDHDDPSRIKNVNYHDKSNNYEKEKPYKEERKKQKIIDETLISLHHDIDVNYLAHPNTQPVDAELIDVKEIMKKHKKKSYKNVNAIDKKGKENFYKNLKEIDLTTIPSSNNSALIARYIIHNVDWTALGTLSTNIKTKGGPFVNVISVSDGPTYKGSGVPFFYMTPKDFSSLDLEKDNRSCITVTLAQTDFCKNKNLDPESPLCARLILYGKVKKIKPGSEEEDFARLALFSRHPEMKTWPEDHDWFFSKLKIRQIILINHFGGASYISLQDYFNIDNV